MIKGIALAIVIGPPIVAAIIFIVQVFMFLGLQELPFVVMVQIQDLSMM